MAFVRANPSGWAVGDILTSAQMNALDIDHKNALDKTVAGDAINGTVGFGGAGAITANLAGSIIATHVNAIQSNISGGIVPVVLGGINDGGIVQGITATVGGGISATVANSIRSDAAGGMAANGGAGDYIQYLQVRNVTTFMPPLVHALGTGWSVVANDFPYLIAPGTTATQSIPLTKYYNALINGATLLSVTMYIVVTATHSGGGSIAGMVMPSMNVIWTSVIPGSPPAAPVSLSAGGALFFSNPGTGNAWYNSGNVQTLQFNCNQHNALGGSSVYTIIVNDESGTGSASGNRYWGFMLSFGQIANSGPIL